METINSFQIWFVFFVQLTPVWISLLITFSALFFWRKHLGVLGHLCNSTIGLVGLFIVLFWIFGAFFADMIALFEPFEQSGKYRRKPPGTINTNVGIPYIFGTDTLGRDLFSRMFYGSQTVLLIAAYFGEQEINWPEDEKTIGLIVSILLIQLIAIFGAIFTSKLSKKFGNIYTLIILNFFWALLCIGAYFITKPIEFYVAAALVGLVMGGIQALSRSTFSKMIPETENTTSYFSFYDVSQKVSIVFGMTLFAFLDQITGSMRSSILVFIIIFLVGAFLLKRIKIKNY